VDNAKPASKPSPQHRWRNVSVLEVSSDRQASLAMRGWWISPMRARTAGADALAAEIMEAYRAQKRDPA
jgi:ribosomal protein S7